MRILNGIFAVLLVLFVAVQWNDPDGVFWMFVYGIGAVWCALAAFRPAIFAQTLPFALYGLTFVAGLFGLVRYWPSTPGWWQQDVWWETETAREGMGMMILVLALIIAGFIVLRTRRAA